MLEGPTGNPGNVAQILEALGVHRRSGKCQIMVDADAYAVHVDRGNIIYATSSQRMLRLGHLLLQRGAVQPLYLHEILKGRRTVARDAALGSVLVRDGAVTLDDLAAGVEEQAVEVLSRILDVDGATFLFDEEEPMPAGIEVIPIRIDHVLATAERRNVERSGHRLMQRLLPRPDQSLRLAVQLALVSYLLSDAELLVALHVDRGTATVEVLEQALPIESSTLRRTIISLLERGYLTVHERAHSGGPIDGDAG
jgi:hypothetical protein